MNRSNLTAAFVAAALALGTSAAFAEGNNFQTYPDVQVQSQATRAQVKSEIAQARSEGLMTANAAEYPPIAQSTGLTRAQVKSEIAEARADGLMTANAADYPPVAATSHLTREQVKQELARAQAAGELKNANRS